MPCPEAPPGRDRDARRCRSGQQRTRQPSWSSRRSLLPRVLRLRPLGLALDESLMGGRTPAPITERKTRLDGTVAEYPCEGLIVEAGRRAVVRYVTERDRHLEGTDLMLRTGTLTIGHFWTDRTYNVYH